MPRLKRPPDPYRDLRIMFLGEMGVQNVTQEQLGQWIGYSRVTANKRLKHPETLTLRELRTVADKLGIPLDALRDKAFPVRR